MDHFVLDITRNNHYHSRHIENPMKILRTNNPIEKENIPKEIDGTLQVAMNSVYPSLDNSGDENIISVLFHEFKSLRNALLNGSNNSPVTVLKQEKMRSPLTSRYVNQKEVIHYLGKEKVFWILVEEFGLVALREEHKCNIYLSKDVLEKCQMFDLNIAA